MLEAAGKRVHVYTSPHLVRFHERIELAGSDGKARPIGEAALVDVLERTQARQRRRRRHSVRDHDGGRLPGLRRASGRRADAGGRPRRPARRHQRGRTPALTVITPIAMDHADKLGDTIAKIACEKAGILKRGGPCVVAQPEEACWTSSARRPARRGSAGRLGRATTRPSSSAAASSSEAERLLDLPLPALMGRHQIANAGAAVAAALQLAELGIDDDAIERGLTGGALAGAHAATRSTARCRAAQARLRAVARRRPQPCRRGDLGADPGRFGGAAAEAGRPRRRHDGLEGRRRFPGRHSVAW